MLSSLKRSDSPSDVASLEHRLHRLLVRHSTPQARVLLHSSNLSASHRILSFPDLCPIGPTTLEMHICHFDDRRSRWNAAAICYGHHMPMAMPPAILFAPLNVFIRFQNHTLILMV